MEPTNTFTKPRNGNLRLPTSPRSSAGSKRTPVSSIRDEANSRASATERARTFIQTPDTRPVNVHQFYADLDNDYEIQPGMVFYDEDTEEEDEEEEEEQADVTTLQGHTQTVQGHVGVSDERPESVLTDVTIDGMVDQDLAELSGVQTTSKHKAAIMSLSTVDEKQGMVTTSSPTFDLNRNDNASFKHSDIDEAEVSMGGRAHDKTIDDFLSADGGLSFGATAVDEETLEAARTRNVADASIDSRSEITRLMVEKLRNLYTDGLAHKAAGRYDEAVRCFSKIITLKPESLLSYVQRAECYLLSADFASAIINYKRVCCLHTNSKMYYDRLAFIYYLQGQILFDSQQYTEALEYFTQAAEMKPGNESYHTRSIACLAALQRHGECLALVNRRLEHEKNNTDLYVMRSRLHLMFKNISLCYYDLKDALELQPDHAEARQIMEDFKRRAADDHTSAVQLSLQGRHRDALQKITAAIECDPTQANFHNIRGALHRELKDFNSAVDDYLLALDKTNHNESSPIYQDAQRQLLLTYNDFAIECFKKGFFQESVILLTKALKGEKREKGLYVNRGDCFFRSGDLQFALADYHQALEIEPFDDSVRVRISIIHNEFGTAEYQNKNYVESESRFTLAIRHNPRVPHYYLSRARARYMQDNQGGSRTDLLSALLLNIEKDSVISLTSRLFPGKTLEEIMISNAAQAVKRTLSQVFDVHASADGKLAPIGSAPATREEKRARTVERRAKQKYQACLEEEEFNRILTLQKHEVQSKVKTTLKERMSLRNTNPRLNLVPQSTDKAKSHSAPPSGWRTFSRGIAMADC